MPTRPPSRTLDPELDARLAERCVSGDRRAWEALVRRHQRLVYGIARSYRLSEEDLGDVFQEVFAALVRSLPRLRDARALVRWLSVTSERIARSTALRRRREAALGAAHGPEGEDPVDQLVSGDEPVGADLERHEREAWMRMALGAASDRCRRLLTALYYEDPTPPYAELSERLGVPIGSLGPTRARCFEKLRAELSRIAGVGISGTPSPTSGAGAPAERHAPEPASAPDPDTQEADG